MTAVELDADALSVNRGVVEGMRSPRPLVAQLPALLQEDEFCERLTTAFDSVVAPVYSTLDCWDSYLDPHLAPDDFVDWLASWVGLEIDETWTLERRRRLVEEIVSLYRIRGTVSGLASHIRLYSGVEPEILENGGCMWSQTTQTALPGAPGPHLTVRLQVDDPATVHRGTVERIVASSRPAHLSYSVEIVSAGGAVAGSDQPTGGKARKPAAKDAVPGAVDLPGSERIDLAPPGPEVADAQPDEPTDEPAEEPPDGGEPTE
jgi:phage tail-like protein